MKASRYGLSTPALVVDLDALEANIACMAEKCRAAKIGLRPHVKSHKSTEIARRQVDAGALGVCCATVDEAATMAAAGITGILITSPVVTPGKIATVIAIALGPSDVMVVADDAGNVAAWNAAASTLTSPLQVLVDLDVGHHRSGVTSVEGAVTLAQAIDASDHLAFAGLQAYAGHVQHIEAYGTRLHRATTCAGEVGRVCNALAAANLSPRIVSGGGTGTHAIEPILAAFTELQAGSYIFMDAEYGRVALEADRASPFRPSLFVQATVISRNVLGFVQTDAGTKAFAVNGPPPEIISGAPVGSTYSYLGDEHGRITLPPGSVAPRIGDRIECLTSHCDPTVHLYDRYMCVRGDELVGTWPVDARRHQ